MYEHLADTLQLWGEIVAEEYKNKLDNEGITASGNLANSVKMVYNENGVLFEVSLSLADYWKNIEDGRGPTKNDGDGAVRRNILEWIRVKPVIPRPMENGKLPTEAQLAYLISRKIHTLGYEGKQPLKRTMDELREEIVKDIKVAVEKDLSREVTVILHSIDGK